MVSVTDLWIPILVSAVAVFVVSAIIHMVLPYHRSDLKAVPREDEFLDAIRQLNIPPGDYGAPHAPSPAAMSSPPFIEKMKRGPVALITVAPGQLPSMGKNLTLRVEQPGMKCDLTMPPA